jgi:aminocarboxymuconate-semialdehyde decarboxylase
LAPIRQAIALNPQEAARRMFYDNLVYDAATIHRLLDVFGTSQIMVGTDYPFTIMDKEPAARLDALQLPASVKVQLQRDNALRWLGL